MANKTKAKQMDAKTEAAFLRVAVDTRLEQENQRKVSNVVKQVKGKLNAPDDGSTRSSNRIGTKRTKVVTHQPLKQDVLSLDRESITNSVTSRSTSGKDASRSKSKNKPSATKQETNHPYWRHILVDNM